MKNKPTLLDQLLFKYRILIIDKKRIIQSAASGILFGMLVNTMSSPELSSTLRDIFNNIFQVQNRPLNYLSWISFVILIFVPLSEYVLKIHHKKRRLESIFQKLLIERIDSEIKQFSNGTIAYGTSLTLQKAPELTIGWKLNKIQIRHDSKKFKIPHNKLEHYNTYFKANFDKKGFVNDGIKFMITTNPNSFTDSPNLKLEIQECNYSQVQFFKDEVYDTERKKYIEDILKELKISFPHSLCLHLIIVTQDKKVLTTLRSEKVAYFPKTWSVSIEEQLHKKDLLDGPNNLFNRWLKRTLEEEIGIDESEFSLLNFRLLSIFLESDIMNCSVCGIIKLESTSEELDKILQIKPRKDNEFKKWNFLSFFQLKKEFLSPSQNYHPTSSYRIFMALLNKYGEISIINEIWNNKNNSV